MQEYTGNRERERERERSVQSAVFSMAWSEHIRPGGMSKSLDWTGGASRVTEEEGEEEKEKREEIKERTFLT